MPERRPGPSPGRGPHPLVSSSLWEPHPLCGICPEQPTGPWGCSALEGGGHLSSPCPRLWKVLDAASVFLGTRPSWGPCLAGLLLRPGGWQSGGGGQRSTPRLSSPNLPGVLKHLCRPPAAVPPPGRGSVYPVPRGLMGKGCGSSGGGWTLGSLTSASSGPSPAFPHPRRGPG